ncbi:spore cortex-lytic enzyme [Paenibacillus mesophilus]|nr:spore cortex-lytic enzyme [Paenibacillus mesophilus]
MAAILVAMALIATIVFSVAPKVGSTFSNVTFGYGASGSDVYELQGRLAYLDYYRGPIDGSFGWQTDRAVRDFQYKFGMKVDGVVGPKTKLMLWNATKNWSPGTAGGAAGGGAGGGNVSSGPVSQFSSADISLMAKAVYGEARGESYTGQVAVAAVILNRVRSASFPNTVSGVIFQSGAFTAVADGQIWLTPNDSAYNAVRDAINGWDPSGEALYYFNPDTATSAWIWSRPQIKRIGKHIFCK